MTNRFWLYRCRHGDEGILTPATKEGWDYLITQMERCNRISVEECREEGFDVSGSFEEGYLSIDDGGRIEEIFLTDPEDA